MSLTRRIDCRTVIEHLVARIINGGGDWQRRGGASVNELLGGGHLGNAGKRQRPFMEALSYSCRPRPIIGAGVARRPVASTDVPPRPVPRSRVTDLRC